MAQITFSGDFQMGTSGSPTSLTDYSTLVKSIKIGRSGQMFDVAALGDTAQKYIKGLIDGQIDIEFYKTAALETALNNLLTYTSGGVSWQMGPEGTTSGNTKYSQTGTLNTSTGVGLILEKFDADVTIGTVKMISASFKISGSVTVGTY